MWFIGVEVDQETSAPPPKKNPGSAPGYVFFFAAIESFSNEFMACYLITTWMTG